MAIKNQSIPNSTRFTNAYNVIDNALRVQYNFKNNVTFSDLIRRCSSLNTVIRVYEDDLVDFARLRNAIIHNKSEQVIAEPHTEVVELMEKIARLVSTPPLAIDAIKSGDVAVIDCKATIRDLMLTTGKVGYSSIPIYNGNELIGVMRWRKLVEVLATYVIAQGQNIDDFINNTTLENFLHRFPCNMHFTLTTNTITIEETLTLFNHNRKLACIIITPDGSSHKRPLGIITGADVMDLMKILEDY